MSAENEQVPNGTPDTQRGETSEQTNSESTSKKFIDFYTEDPEKRLSKNFRRALSNSERAVIVLVFGPGKVGKSTLLNFLTVDGYPFPRNGGSYIPPEAIDMAKFVVRSGDKPCTIDFDYIKMSASEFRGIHNIPADDSNDFDIFFIDSEGFGNTIGASRDLFLGLFTLMGVSCVQLFLHNSPTRNDYRIECLAQSIVAGKILGNSGSNIISITARGTADLSGVDSSNDIQEVILNKLKEQDEGNENEFIEKLREKAEIKEINNETGVTRNIVSIITLPECCEDNGAAYRERIKDLSRMILEKAEPRNGKELLGTPSDENNDSKTSFSKAYSKVIQHKQTLEGELSMSSVYNSLLIEFIKQKLMRIVKETLQDFRSRIQCNLDELEAKNYYYNVRTRRVDEIEQRLNELNSRPEELNESQRREKNEIQVERDTISSEIRDEYREFNELVSLGCRKFEREIMSIIPDLNSLNSFVKDHLAIIKKNIKFTISNELSTLIEILKLLKNSEGVMGRLYEVNESLGRANVGDIVTINLIDNNGNMLSDKTMRVKVISEEFNYTDSNGVERNNHQIFPAGIDITEHELTTTKQKLLGLTWTTTYDPPNGKPKRKQIADQFCFDFKNMQIIRKEEISQECSSYEYYYNYWLGFLIIGYTEGIPEKWIEISVANECDLKITGYKITKTNWPDLKTTSFDLRCPMEPSNPLKIKADTHTLHGKANTARFIYAKFELKEPTQ